MSVRAIRGATHLEHDDAQEMSSAVVELLLEMLHRNHVDNDALISIIFTATPDLHAAFPAAFARDMGLTDVPLMCAQELAVAEAMPRVIRIMMHVNTEVSRADIVHPYLRGTNALRSNTAAAAAAAIAGKDLAESGSES